MAKIISQHFCFLSNNKLGTEKSMMKFLLERKIDKWKEMISMRMLVLSYTI